MAAIPRNLIPSKRKQDLRSKYENDPEAWKNFVSRIQKNPNIKAFILSRDKVCQACGEVFDNQKKTPLHVHHIDYDHICIFGKTISICSETRVSHLPDCGCCQMEQPDAFKKCVARLVAVHPICNKKIEKMAERYYLQSPDDEASAQIKTTITAIATSDGQTLSIKKGTILQWIENIKSSTERTGLRNRRRLIAGLQAVTGCVEIIEGDFLIVKILEARVIETIADTEFRVYSVGDIVRKKASTFIRRQGKILEGASGRITN